jgi:hypothetical protein
LAADEREIATELQEEALEVTDECLLDIRLRVLVLESEELQHVRVLDLLLGRDRVVGRGHGALAEHRRLVSGERRALVELAVDLPAKLSNRPPAAQRLGLVEGSGVL